MLRAKNWLRDNRWFIAAVLLFGVFRTAIADWNPIPSGSMHPNLLEGDVVFVNRLAFDVKIPLTDVVLAHTGDPQRGDIVTFSSPQDGTRLIKRVIGSRATRSRCATSVSSSTACPPIMRRSV